MSQSITPSKTPNKTVALIAAATIIVLPITASHEGLITYPNRDPVGIKEVCYGETNVPMRDYTKAQCNAILSNHLATVYGPKIAACLPNVTLPHVFAAFLDAAYNAGPGAVCRSRMALEARSGHYFRACAGFSGWYVTARGKRLPGLVNRRFDEMRLCFADFNSGDFRWQEGWSLLHTDWTYCAVDKRGDPLGPESSPNNVYPRRMDEAAYVYTID